MGTGRIDTSNEAFISFSFAIVSVLMVVYYLPWSIRLIRGTILYYKIPLRDRKGVLNPLSSVKLSFINFFSTAIFCLTNTSTLIEGIKIGMKEKDLFFFTVVPTFFSQLWRPRVFLPVLWVVLLFSAMYVTLTFDPHAILGIPSSSSTAEVKKAYRTLARRYHPDHNNTEEARALFIQARRAYKALVDRDAFEEEEMNIQELSVGVALPGFLSSGEHDGLVLFGLLALVFGVPTGLWYKLKPTNKIDEVIDSIKTDAKRTRKFMRYFGVKEDPKWSERQLSEEMLANVLVELRLANKAVAKRAAEKFPLLPEFIERCVDVERNKTFLNNIGLTDASIPIVQAHMVSNGMKLLEAFEVQGSKFSAEQELPLLSKEAYKATRYLYEQHILMVNEALKELLKIGNNFPRAKKLHRLHGEIFDCLDLLYGDDEKRKKVAMTQLEQAVPRVVDLVSGIQDEIVDLFRRHYKFQLEKNSSKEELRAYKKQNKNY